MRPQHPRDRLEFFAVVGLYGLSIVCVLAYTLANVEAYGARRDIRPTPIAEQAAVVSRL